MNAAEQANSIQVATKIATVVRLFKNEFPDLRADLSPWTNDPETRDLLDPDSADLGFHLPGVSRLFKCRSLLVQIRFHTDADTQETRAIGVEVAGFDHRGKQWNLSTIQQWHFVGDAVPEATVAEKLKACCRKIFQVFNETPELQSGSSEYE